MDSTYIPCKFCAEMILKDAEFCPHCIRKLQERSSVLNILMTMRVFIAVIVGCLAVALPHHPHFHKRKLPLLLGNERSA